MWVDYVPPKKHSIYDRGMIMQQERSTSRIFSCIVAANLVWVKQRFSVMSQYLGFYTHARLQVITQSTHHFERPATPDRYWTRTVLKFSPEVGGLRVHATIPGSITKPTNRNALHVWKGLKTYLKAFGRWKITWCGQYCVVV